MAERTAVSSACHWCGLLDSGTWGSFRRRKLSRKLRRSRSILFPGDLSRFCKKKSITKIFVDTNNIFQFVWIITFFFSFFLVKIIPTDVDHFIKSFILIHGNWNESVVYRYVLDVSSISLVERTFEKGAREMDASITIFATRAKNEGEEKDENTWKPGNVTQERYRREV